MFSSARFRIYSPHVCVITLRSYLPAHRGRSLALLIARLLATGWSTYALWRTMNIQTRMQQLIEGPDSPCQLKMLGPYFTKRFSLQVCFVMLYLSTVPQPQYAFPGCGLGLTLGCPLPFHLPLLASLQSMRLSRSCFARTPLLTFVRCIVLILLGASVRRKTSCGCMGYVSSSAPRSSPCMLTCLCVVFSRSLGQHPAVRFHPGQCDGALGRSTSSWSYQEAFLSYPRIRRNIH